MPGSLRQSLWLAPFAGQDFAWHSCTRTVHLGGRRLPLERLAILCTNERWKCRGSSIYTKQKVVRSANAGLVYTAHAPLDNCRAPSAPAGRSPEKIAATMSTELPARRSLKRDGGRKERSSEVTAAASRAHSETPSGCTNLAHARVSAREWQKACFQVDAPYPAMMMATGARGTFLLASFPRCTSRRSRRNHVTFRRRISFWSAPKNTSM